MSKRHFKELERLLKSVKLEESAGDLGGLDSASAQNNILRLISKCKALVVKLKCAGVASEIINELLVTIVKLQLILLKIFKKKRQKLMDLHWEQIQEENARLLKQMNQNVSKS